MTIADAAKVLGISKQAVHKQIKSKGIKTPKIGNKFYIDHETGRQLFKLKFKSQIIGVQLMKGGVGKTTITFSTATRASTYGARVLCVDMDAQANLTFAFNIDASQRPVMCDILEGDALFLESIVNVAAGIDLLPSRLDNGVLDDILASATKRHRLEKVYASLLQPLKEKYDLILIDCPPAMGRSVAAITLACDWILAPIFPDEFSMQGLRRLASKEEEEPGELAKIRRDFEKDIPFRILVNKVNDSTWISEKVIQEILTTPLYNERRMQAYIRQSQQLTNVITQRLCIYDSTKPSREKEDFDKLTREILNFDGCRT